MGNAALECCKPSGPTKEEDDGSSRAKNRVELAVSELFAIPGVAAAYHTSIIVNGEEFFFSDSGIIYDANLGSHQGKPKERIELGCSNRTGAQLCTALGPDFKPGTYDLVRKNCNTFSDCALYFLLRKRLDKKYSTLERLGKANLSLLKVVTQGLYAPNPAAASFEVESTIEGLHLLSDAAQKVSSDDHMRRLLYKEGAEVVICGLMSAVELNNKAATVDRYNAVNGRWDLRVSTGEVKAVRAENIRPAGELILKPSDRVRIIGLRSEHGRVLNGLEGEIVCYLPESQRYEVKVGSDTKAMRSENLQEA